MKLAISAGHGKNDEGLPDPGTVNPRLNIREHDVAVEVARHLVAACRKRGHDVFVVEYGKYSLLDKIRVVNAEHAIRPISLAIEIHFNSNVGKPGRGTEVYAIKAMNAAISISSYLSEAINTFDRGGKQGNYAWIKRTAMPAVIVEVLFLNNDLEAKKVFEPDFARRAAQAILFGFEQSLV